VSIQFPLAAERHVVSQTWNLLSRNTETDRSPPILSLRRISPATKEWALPKAEVLQYLDWCERQLAEVRA
jgi:hypothetical protein